MTYKVKCPFCGSDDTDAEFVDIGVGEQQVSPYCCVTCGAHQMHPYHDDPSQGDTYEQKVGWWKGRGSPDVSVA